MFTAEPVSMLWNSEETLINPLLGLGQMSVRPP